MDVPYAFVKSNIYLKLNYLIFIYLYIYIFIDKARLGKLVHQKTAVAVALTEVRKEDSAEVENLV